MEGKIRVALVMNENRRASEVVAYMPSNYRVLGDDDGPIYVIGRDRAGWTLDGYVIPRLQSGLLTAVELQTGDAWQGFLSHILGD